MRAASLACAQAWTSALADTWTRASLQCASVTTALGMLEGRWLASSVRCEHRRKSPPSGFDKTKPVCSAAHSVRRHASGASRACRQPLARPLRKAKRAPFHNFCQPLCPSRMSQIPRTSLNHAPHMPPAHTPQSSPPIYAPIVSPRSAPRQAPRLPLRGCCFWHASAGPPRPHALPALKPGNTADSAPDPNDARRPLLCDAAADGPGLALLAHHLTRRPKAAHSARAVTAATCTQTGPQDTH